MTILVCITASLFLLLYFMATGEVDGFTTRNRIDLPGSGEVAAIRFAHNEPEVVYWARYGIDKSSVSNGSPGMIGRLDLQNMEVVVLDHSRHLYRDMAVGKGGKWFGAAEDGIVMGREPGSGKVHYGAGRLASVVEVSDHMIYWGDIEGTFHCANLDGHDGPTSQSLHRGWLTGISINENVLVTVGWDKRVVLRHKRIGASSEYTSELIKDWVRTSANGIHAVGTGMDIRFLVQEEDGVIRELFRHETSAVGTWLPSRDAIYVATKSGEIQLIDFGIERNSPPSTQVVLRRKFNPGIATAIAVNKDGSIIVVGYSGGRIEVFRL